MKVEEIINRITGKRCSLASTWMVTLHHLREFQFLKPCYNTWLTFSPEHPWKAVTFSNVSCFLFLFCRCAIRFLSFVLKSVFFFDFLFSFRFERLRSERTSTNEEHLEAIRHMTLQSESVAATFKVSATRRRVERITILETELETDH